MSRQKQDRRSQRTQQLLIEALIDILDDKNYDQISVNDIIQRANVGRSTFYAHYQTKDDLLKSGFERALDILIDNININPTEYDLSMDITPFFYHTQGHYQLYRTLVWGSGHEILTREGHAILSQKIQKRLELLLPGVEEPAVPMPVLCYTLAGNLMLLLQWWLDNKMPYSPEKMNEIFQQLSISQVKKILSR